MHSTQLRNPRAGGLGLGLVLAIHALMVWALIHGMTREPGKPKPPPIVLQPQQPVIEREPEPPPPPTLPRQASIPPVYVPAPDVAIDVPVPPQQALHTTSVAPPVTANEPRQPAAPSVALPGSAAAPAIASPGAICTRMAKPEVPSVNWAGDAVLKAVATVRGGRVVHADVRVLSGAMDARTRRALQNAVSSTLQDGYECPGNHVFEQEFAIRVE